MSDVDDIDFEPHTPATLHENHNVADSDARGLFPSLSDPMPATARPVAVSSQSPGQSQTVGSAQRFSHNPYVAGSPRTSPPIAVYSSNNAQTGPPDYGSPPNVMTPSGSLGRAHLGPGSQPKMGSAGAHYGSPHYAGAASNAVPVTGSRPYKSEVCRQFSFPGGCPRGAQCPFVHGEEELSRSGDAAGSAPRFSGPGSSGSLPRRSAAMDDGGRMGVAMAQAVPLPSWMSGTGSPAVTSQTAAPPASAAIPISPLAEAMLRPSSLPKSAAGAPSVGPNSTAGSAPKFGSAKRA
jgi:hypothetical protein